MKKTNPDDVVLSQEIVDNIIDTILDELEIEQLGLEGRDTLERIICLSVGLYMMELRERVTKTSRLTQ